MNTTVLAFVLDRCVVVPKCSCKCCSYMYSLPSCVQNSVKRTTCVLAFVLLLSGADQSSIYSLFRLLDGVFEKQLALVVTYAGITKLRRSTVKMDEY